jgi:hypothetical protein
MKTLWNASKPLTAVGLLMLVILVPSVVGIWADSRVITGAPAWLKPSKFAISTAIYSLTLAWVFTYLPGRKRLCAITGWITAVVLVLEVAVIDIQAARGTTSHFNNTTPLDTVLFGAMGGAILILWFASVAVAVALFRQPFSDRAMGWALRLGLAIHHRREYGWSARRRPRDSRDRMEPRAWRLASAAFLWTPCDPDPAAVRLAHRAEPAWTRHRGQRGLRGVVRAVDDPSPPRPAVPGWRAVTPPC